MTMVRNWSPSANPAERVAELTTVRRGEAAKLLEGERLHVAVLPTETFF